MTLSFAFPVFEDEHIGEIEDGQVRTRAELDDFVVERSPGVERSVVAWFDLTWVQSTMVVDPDSVRLNIEALLDANEDGLSLVGHWIHGEPPVLAGHLLAPELGLAFQLDLEEIPDSGQEEVDIPLQNADAGIRFCDYVGMKITIDEPTSVSGQNAIFLDGDPELHLDLRCPTGEDQLREIGPSRRFRDRLPAEHIRILAARSSQAGVEIEGALRPRSTRRVRR